MTMDAIEEIAPFIAGQGMVDGRATVYVCENYACKLPVTDVPDLVSLLQ